jgi:hypothetical protein
MFGEGEPGGVSTSYSTYRAYYNTTRITEFDLSYTASGGGGTEAQYQWAVDSVVYPGQLLAMVIMLEVWDYSTASEYYETYLMWQWSGKTAHKFLLHRSTDGYDLNRAKFRLAYNENYLLYVGQCDGADKRFIAGGIPKATDKLTYVVSTIPIQSVRTVNLGKKTVTTTTVVED